MHDIELADLTQRIIREVRPYSQVPDEGLAATVRLTLAAIDAGIPGDLVECGTWKGGASFAMLLAQRYAYGEIRRPVWMYDSFQGMDQPAEQDGASARKWRDWTVAEPGNPKHFNNCSAALDNVLDAAKCLELNYGIRIMAGWFHETLRSRSEPGQIAVLRIDCDWYEPVKLVYEAFAPRVSVGGPIIIDDYDRWEGCVLATHEYLANHKLPWRIKSIPPRAGAYMIKEKENW